MSTTTATPTPTPEHTSSPIPAAPTQAAPAAPPSPNVAVQNCLAMYYQILAAERAAGYKCSLPPDSAQEAYCAAMPFLNSRAAIADFIACVAHGMLLKIFWNIDGLKLITAARAALAALPSESRSAPGSLSGDTARPAGRPRTADQDQ